MFPRSVSWIEFFRDGEKFLQIGEFWVDTEARDDRRFAKGEGILRVNLSYNMTLNPES
jgi:hypothetical protein